MLDELACHPFDHLTDLEAYLSVYGKMSFFFWLEVNSLMGSNLYHHEWSQLAIFAFVLVVYVKLVNSSNFIIFLLWCGTWPCEGGTELDSNSLE